MNKTRPTLTADGHTRSFGRVANRMTVAEQAALDARLAPHSVDVAAPIDLAAVFPDHTGPLLVEVGMGKGEQIVQRARQTPQGRFIGCEVYRNGLEKVLRVLDAEGLTNLRLCPHDGRALLDALPAGSVDHLLVLYPDPWPKKKHHKRRIIQADFLAAADRVLSPDGTLLLVTDIVDYALWMLSTVYAHGVFHPTAIGPSDWATPPADWHPTGYERKALREGRRPFYFTLMRKSALATQLHNLKTPAC
jgi:tRNA (guanine-N7-)-methyltransferase